LAGRPAKHRDRAACRRSVRALRRRGCEREFSASDAHNFSIPPCCPAFVRGNRVADRKAPRAERGRRYVARESVKRAPVLTKPMPDEARPRSARREVSPAKVLADDRVEAQRPFT